MSNRLRTFLGELKRRKVYHVAAAYVVVGAILGGVANDFLPRLGAPEWTIGFIILLILIGFPIALVLAWAYELKPEGDEPAAAERKSPEEKDASPPRVSEPISEDFPVAHSLPKDRIAILPFASIHPDREHDYFADGITEELISAISRVQGLDVIARTSVMKYRDSDARIGDIGRDLNVGVVLEGSVRKAGDQLRVTVQLINAESEGHLWAEDYDREFREIFAVQRDIASHVADALRLRLLTPDAERIGTAPTEDLAAYDLYLLGRHHLGHRSDAGIRKAISCFERAVELDEGFAPGYAGLSQAYILAALGYVSEPPRDVQRLARRYAEDALRLDDNLAEAHASLGWYSAVLAWDTKAAEREFRRAIEINPSHAWAHQWMAQLLVVLNRPREAIEASKRALELDPSSPILTAEVGMAHTYVLEYSEALACHDRALEMDPNLPISHYNRGFNLLCLDRYEEAVEAFVRALELLPTMPYGRASLAAAYAQHGNEETAKEILAELVEEDSDDNPFRTFIAVAQEALGMKEDALASIRKAVHRREPWVPYISLAWMPFHSLQSSPEYQSLVEEISGIIGR